MAAALCTLDVAGGLNQPLRRDISAPADPVDRRDCQARDAGQRSTHASGDGSCDASLLGARSGTCDGRSHRHANAGRNSSGGRAQAHAEARAKVLRLLFHGRHRVLLSFLLQPDHVRVVCQPGMLIRDHRRKCTA